MGFRYYVDLHVLVDGSIPVTQGHRIAHQVKDATLSQEPKIAAILVQIEPTPETRD